MRMTCRPFLGLGEWLTENFGAWRSPFRWGNRHNRPKVSCGAGMRPLVWALWSCGTTSPFCPLVPTLPVAASAPVAETVACGLGWGGSQQGCSDPLNPAASLGKESGGKVKICVLLIACRETEAGAPRRHLRVQREALRVSVEPTLLFVPEKQVLGEAAGWEGGSGFAPLAPQDMMDPLGTPCPWQPG